MGKIKSKLIKRTAKSLIEKGVEFADSFEKNKMILGKNMPSTKVRNQLAGYISRLKTQEKQAQQKMLLTK